MCSTQSDGPFVQALVLVWSVCKMAKEATPSTHKYIQITGIFWVIQTTVHRHATVFRTGWWASSFRPLARMCDSQSCSLFDFSYYASGTLGAGKKLFFTVRNPIPIRYYLYMYIYVLALEQEYSIIFTKYIPIGTIYSYLSIFSQINLPLTPLK